MNFEISSPTIGLITEALSKAQGCIGSALKDSKNPFFKSDYASLSAVTEASKKALHDNNLAFTSSVVMHSAIYYLVATLSHSSGEWLRSYIPLLVDKPDMQKLGGAISYARRYSLASLCHVATEDLDGEDFVDRSTVNKSSGEVQASPSTFPTGTSNGSKTSISEKQKLWLIRELAKAPRDKVEALKEKYGCSDLTLIEPSRFNGLILELAPRVAGAN